MHSCSNQKPWAEGHCTLDDLDDAHRYLTLVFARKQTDKKGEPLNDGEHMCNATLMAIMGRMAAYTGQEISWEQVMESLRQKR